MNWGPFDFVAAAVLLFGAFLASRVATGSVHGSRRRLFIVGMVIVAVIIIWLELAVGLFGSPVAGQ